MLSPTASSENLENAADGAAGWRTFAAAERRDPEPGLSPEIPLSPDERAAVDGILRRVIESLERQTWPLATYRVQFNAQQRFQDVLAWIKDLAILGISDLYSSPFLESREGSLHHYDIVDHARISQEIGTLEDIRALSSELKRYQLGLIVDVVPNHMAACPEKNAWWRDVLENGPSSAYASYFDIDWMPLKPDLANKVLLPILGDQYGAVLEEGHLQVEYSEGGFRLRVYDRNLPLTIRSCALILAPEINRMIDLLGQEHPDVQELISITNSMASLASTTEADPQRLDDRRRERDVLRRRLRQLVESSELIRNYVADCVRRVNGAVGNPESFDLLDQLLQEQAYRLAHWGVAAEEINYRRFFDVNELAALCMERDEVFEQAHALLFELMKEGVIQGLRIDHPDGLYDPGAYLSQLQGRRFLQRCQDVWELLPESERHDWDRLAGRLTELWSAAVQIPGSPIARPMYLVVEKILEHGEPLPVDWLTHGTVGYEFLNAVTGVFVEQSSEKSLTRFYAQFTRAETDFAAISARCKRLIAHVSMASELNVMAHRLDRISERNRRTRDFTLNSLSGAIGEVVSEFEVYRTYIQPARTLERDRQYVESAVARARRDNRTTSTGIYDFLQDVLLLRHKAGEGHPEIQADVQSFVGKFQQLTGPIMAKAIEDTAFYRFHRLAALNEVGGAPDRFGTSVDEFHQMNHRRAMAASLGMSATSTHDTKRSEDVRCRVVVLSEVPQLWRSRVNTWARMHRSAITEIDGEPAPSRNDQYVFYQSLLGIWPAHPTEVNEQFVERLQTYMLKVVREAKLQTSWINPFEPYEQATRAFIDAVLKGRQSKAFLEEFHDFANKVAIHGVWNSLGTVLLKVVSPGVPDFYQGTERWHFALVDPDNRQPVAWEPTRQGLAKIQQKLAEVLGGIPQDDSVTPWISTPSSLSAAQIAQWSEYLGGLIRSPEQDGIKLLVTLLALRTRRHYANLFQKGDYSPCQFEGAYADCGIGVIRSDSRNVVLAVAPRLTVRLCGFGGPAPLGDVWGDTCVVWPTNIDHPRRLRDVFSGREIVLTDQMRLSELLSDFPVGLWVGERTPVESESW